MRGQHKTQARADQFKANKFDEPDDARSAPVETAPVEAVESSNELIGLHHQTGGQQALLPGIELQASAGETSDDELISRSLGGDHDAFEVLVRRHSPRVFNIIGSFFRRRDMIEDISQEVFSRSYFSLASFTIGRSFPAWVAKIAVNACYDHLRAQRRRGEYQMPRDVEREDEWLELQMLEASRDRHASAERQREAAAVAERLLAKLDPEDRLVLVLMDKDGFSVKEVSDMTGWGQSKIKVRAFRARRTLQAAMKRLILNAESTQRNKK